MVIAEVLRPVLSEMPPDVPLRISKDISKTQIEKNTNSNSCWTTFCVTCTPWFHFFVFDLGFLPPDLQNQSFVEGQS